jgi:hypothetical protein
MARNKINLKMQCMQKLDSMAAFGQKKNDKDTDRSDVNYNPTRSEKIHSFSTMKTYKDSASLICDWMKEHHPEVKKIEDITKEHVKEYVDDRHANGYSNFTISKHVSCLNKICNTESRDFWKLSEFGDFKRRSDDVVNNRGVRSENHTDNYARNASAILMASAFGMRRSSTESATVDKLVYHDGKIVAIELQEKGGRCRTAPLLDSYSKQVNEYFEERIAKYGEHCRICDSADSNTNLHAYRGEYARELYSSYREDPSRYEYWRHNHVNDDALHKACSHPRYNTEYIKGGKYHTETLGLVSQALG